MKLILSLLTGLASCSAFAHAGKLLPRGWEFAADSCDEISRDLVTQELDYARQMADAASSVESDNLYFQTFFSQLHLDMGDGFRDSVRGAFSRIRDMLTDGNEDYIINITCDDTTDGCSNPNKKWWAHMNDGTGTMNFCQRFFSPPGDPSKSIQPTKYRIDDCDTIDLRAAQWSRGAVIVHECAHTEYGMSDTSKSLDYAYGFNACYKLAHGTFDRSCVPYKGTKPETILCPDENGNDGPCPEDLEIKNADTWSFVAAGVYFSDKCGKEIPLPDLPTKRSVQRSRVMRDVSVKRRDGCDGLDDYIKFDGDEENE